MKVLALKPGHDGAVAFTDSTTLLYSLEAEVDSFERHSDLTAQLIIEALTAAPDFPDVVAIGGWHKVLPGELRGIGAGYHGLEAGELTPARLFGRNVLFYTSSHERSHIVGSVAMSPFDADTELAVLVWEGVIGSLYRWRGSNSIDRFPVLDQPGARYSALFALAEPTFPDGGAFPRSEYAGKLMALAGLADGSPPASDTRDVVSSLLRRPAMYPFHKGLYRRSGLYNCTDDSPELWRAARLLTDRLFERYLDAARERLPRGLPLVIAGGCGLNCEWNSRWRSCEHFSDVFVPPCADDTGSAIGSAVDAAVASGVPCQLDWSVYAGSPFVWDADRQPAGWISGPLDNSLLADSLQRGCVVAWIQGRSEIGPRALGHRSLLALASDAGMRDELNCMKEREWYRPIAPVCLEEDLGTYFDSAFPDPYMLFFRTVRNPVAIPAVTHADGTTRVQSVNRRSERALHALLIAYRALTGTGVLCNTSLNFKGRGFINRLSELLLYCDKVGVHHIAVDGCALTRATHPDCGASPRK